jgi:hypothetical protein
LDGKPEEKRPLGRTGCRLRNGIKMDFKRMVSEDVVWIS